MAFYEDWSPPAHLPWSGNYPGEEYPDNSVLPWINKLKDDGMEMTAAYAAAPKCGTSRYSTVTGRYASRAASARQVSMRDNKHPVEATIPNTKLQDKGKVEDGQDCSQSNIAQVFQKNGYVTGMVGKWHLTNANSVGGTVAAVKAEVEKCGFMDVGAMYPDNFDGVGGWDDGLHHNMEYVAYKAVEFIENNTANDWFLYVNPTAPHSPDVADAFEVDCRMTTDGNFIDSMENGWSVIGMTAEFEDDCVAYRNDVKERANGSLNSDDLGSIWIDDAIGAIYKALNRTNQLDDTLILFQLDHGKVGKDTLWEGGTRIPQFVHYPNGKLPSTFDGLVSTIDIGPTILDIAGISNTTAVSGSWYEMDGKSWNTAIQNEKGEEADWRDNRCLFFESGDDRAVRCGCDKYMLLGASSPEASEAGAAGWDGWSTSTTEVLTDLCDSDKEYVTASDTVESGEAENIVLSEPLKAVDMATLMTCHLDRTDARDADVVAPLYSECTGSIATPSPTVTSQPTLPVANDPDGIPVYIDSSPWQNDVEGSATDLVLSATVLDNDINRVRFDVRYPDGSRGGYTRGDMVSESGDEATFNFEIDTTASTGEGPGKYGYRLRIEDNSDNSIDYPADSGWIEFVVADTAAEVVTAARTEIASIISAEMPDVNLAAKFVRHGFHDCVGGCDGCVDMTNGDNAGLEVPIAALEPVVDMFSHFGVTRADIWVLAALEGASGQQPDGDAANREFPMEWIGRPTCDDLSPSVCVNTTCSQDRGPDRELPSPSLDTHDLLEFFATEFDFDERDTVAIMGAHTLGTLVRENSGYNGVNGWVGNTVLFDNAYYEDLVGGSDASDTFENFMASSNWKQVFVDNTDLTTPDRWEWERGTDPHIVMINSDMALVRNLTGEMDPDSGEVADCQIKCTRSNLDRCTPKRCPHAPETFDIVVEYKFNNTQFILDFEDAFLRMLNKGFTATNPTIDGCDVDLTPPCNVPATSRRNLRGRKN